MRITALFSAVTAAIALTLAGCGGGCPHGRHAHPIGSSYEQPPDYATSCTCQENGTIDCGGVAVSD